ncbi:MAG: alpha/beta fold hydrolase [Methylobacteriaceae bacterium]|nr:alpha/beta fold hydrolase [Methylobacteriaceae bacterium]
MRGFAAGVAAIALLATGAVTARSENAQLETKNYTIPSGDPGIDLFIRNKHQVGTQQYGPDRILLFVHGATYPAETAFDLPIEGVSMMELFAQQGYDVYLVDVRGYGGSTRPPEMMKPASENKPIVDTKVAAHDLGAAVDHILKSRNVAKIDVMGWSWGTAIAGMYTSEHNDKVNRLVLYAPLWHFRKDTAVLAPAPSAPGAAPPQLGAYRLVSKDSAKARWLKGVAEDKQAGLIPPGVFEQWADATWATDPESVKQNPPMLRAPNGVLQDVNTYFAAGKANYDPGQIKVPTLLIHAEWDADLPSYQAQDYFTKLTNAPYRRFVELSEGTHTVMLEKNRMQFFREILNFLNEERPLALK